MAKKPIVIVDEERIKSDAMGSLNLFIPDDSVSPQEAEIETNAEAVGHKQETASERAKRANNKQVSKNTVADDFEALFLVPNPGSIRCQTYIDRKHYDLIKRYLSAIAPNMSIAGYINNILDHHIELYWPHIEARYNSESAKPLKYDK